LLHPLLEPFGDQLFHLLRRRARPGRDDGHLLDREGRVFGPAKRQKCHNTGDKDRNEQEQGDGALAYGESGEIERAHRGPAALMTALCVSRTRSPSCSRCAPSATTRSPALRSPMTEAASPLRLAICTARRVTRGVSPSTPSTSHTPGPSPGSKIAPIGTIFDPGEGPGVWLVEGVEGDTPRVTRRAVQIASLSGEAASVIGDLKAGDRVVALGAHLLHEGERVRLTQSAVINAAGPR